VPAIKTLLEFIIISVLMENLRGRNAQRRGDLRRDGAPWVAGIAGTATARWARSRLPCDSQMPVEGTG
jgi:hypothetical protein